MARVARKVKSGRKKGEVFPCSGERGKRGTQARRQTHPSGTKNGKKIKTGVGLPKYLNRRRGGRRYEWEGEGEKGGTLDLGTV